jgi:hypothetical protein
MKLPCRDNASGPVSNESNGARATFSTPSNPLYECRQLVVKQLFRIRRHSEQKPSQRTKSQSMFSARTISSTLSIALYDSPPETRAFFAVTFSTSR